MLIILPTLFQEHDIAMKIKSSDTPIVSETSNNLILENKKTILNTNQDRIKWQYQQKYVEKYPIILSQWQNNTYRFTGFNNWSNALKLIETGNCIYEDILICKPYLDYEWYVPIEEYMNNIEKYNIDAIDRLKILHMYVDNSILQLTAKNDYEIVMAKSHGQVDRIKEGTCYKFSYHIVVNGPYRFKCPLDARQLADNIKSISNHQLITNEIDMSVYKSERTKRQKFRCIYSTKTVEDKRKLEPIDIEGHVIKKINIFDYLIGNNDQDNIQYFPEIKNMVLGKNKTKSKKKLNIDTNKENLDNAKQNNNFTEKIHVNEEQDNKIINNIDLNKNIILEKLKKIIPSVYIEINTYDAKSGLTFYSYNYDHNKDSCVHGNNEHDRIGGYAYISIDALSVCAGCYSKDCKKHAINIGRILEPSFWDDIHVDNVEDIGENYNIIDHTLIDNNNIDICDNTNNQKIDHIDDNIHHNDNDDNDNKDHADQNDDNDDDDNYYDDNDNDNDDKNYDEDDNDENDENDDDLDENNNNDKKILKFNTQFVLKNTRIKKEIRLFLKKAKNKGLCLKSIIGSGKTKMLQYMLTNFFKTDGDNKRILVISTRISYANDVQHNVFKKFNFINYKNQKGDLRQCNRLIISLESLHRLFSYDYVKMYDIILLDEIETINCQYFCKTVQNKKDTYEQLNELLKYSNKFVALDADLDNRTIEFVNSITNNTKILHNVYKGLPRKYTFENDDQKYLDSIIENIKNGENVCVVSLSKDYALHLRDKLKELFPDYAQKIVCIHKDADKMLKNELKNIRKNWKKYKVVIYTPIIGVGLNFDLKKHFSHVYGFLVGNIESARTFLQMIGRIRYPINTDVQILISQKVNKNTNAYLYSLEYAHQHQKSIIQHDFFECEKIFQYDQNGHLIMKKNVKYNTFNKLRAYYIQEFQLNNQNSNILTMLKILIETKGDIFETRYTEKIKNNTEKTNNNIIKKKIERIIEMPNINDNEFNTLNNKINPTENDEMTMKKVQMRQELNLNENIANDKLNECLKTYNKNKDTIERILYFYTKIKKNKKNDIYDGIQTIHINSLFEKVIKILDCKFFINTKQYNLDLDAKITNLDITDAEIKSLNTEGKAEDKYEIVKMVLRRFGINLNAVQNRKQIKGLRTYFRCGYEISYDDDINKMIYCKIINETNNYDDEFVKFIKNYDCYRDCIIDEEDKIFQIKKLI